MRLSRPLAITLVGAFLSAVFGTWSEASEHAKEHLNDHPKAHVKEQAKEHPPEHALAQVASHEAAATPSPAKAGTRVCGTLRLAEEWTREGSPYWITGDVFVPITSRLRIEAGTEIRVSSKPQPCEKGEAKPSDAHSQRDLHAPHGEAADTVTQTERNPEDPPLPKDFSDSAYTTITIEGAFYCLGMPKSPVRFLPADTTLGAPPWDAIRVMGQREGRAEVAFTEFHGANIGLYTERADFYVHHSVFADNNTGLQADKRSDVTVLSCVFARNRSAGIYIAGGTPHVVNSVFWNGRGYGIWSDGRKSMSIEYNAFFGNGEDDCYRCHHEILPLGESGLADTSDTFGNHRVDPLFIGSASFIAARALDPRYDTPDHLIKDSAMAAAEKGTRWKWWKKKSDAQVFTPTGIGPYVLSEYSSLRHAGHPNRALRNTDATRGDIGIWGGPQDRITKNPFVGF
jgi:hypothetical protein